MKAEVDVRTGHKWKAPEVVEQAISRFQHLGIVQHDRAGLDWGKPFQLWRKGTKQQRKTVVAEEVTQVEQEHYLLKQCPRASKEHGPNGRTP